MLLRKTEIEIDGYYFHVTHRLFRKPKYSFDGRRLNLAKIRRPTEDEKAEAMKAGAEDAIHSFCHYLTEMGWHPAEVVALAEKVSANTYRQYYGS